MHYYIDGYNILFRTPRDKRSLEADRDALLLALSPVKLSLTVVFDGVDEIPHRSHKGTVEIVYTAKGQTADSYILDEILWVKTPKAHTVVTSDKGLARIARQSGAFVQSVRDFLQFITKKEHVPVKEKPLKEADRHLERLLKIFTKRSLEKLDIN